MAEMTVRIEGTVPVTTTSAAPLLVTQQGATAPSPTLTTATTGNGTAVTFGSAKTNVTMFVTSNGAVTAGVVDLQASQDGTNWVKIASTTGLATGVNAQVSLSPGAAFIFFRGVVSTTVTGGTVTATITYA